MLDLSDTNPNVDVLAAEYARLLGYPYSHELEGRAAELAAAAREWYREHGRPWVYVRETDTVNITEGRVHILETEFASPRLHEQLAVAKADRVMLTAVSAGPECEERSRQLWQEGKPDEYFFMEVFGSAVVEHLITTTGARICNWAEQGGLTVLPHYSPGYSGWDVADQNKLLSLIRQTPKGALPGELHALDSGMLRPKKSLLAVFGVTSHAGSVRHQAGLVPCENCSFSPCRYRRAPYVFSLPQIEDVQRLRRAPNGSTPAVAATVLALDPNARYSLNARALRKWAQERLQLQFLDDGAVRARFQYEGTTCSNMGQPLSYNYEIKLAPPTERYRVLEARCAPTAGDMGHTLMCAYLTDAEAFTRGMTDEQPLLGQPLNDVFAWQRAYSPSGCYCDATGRAHKWGLVYEVLHFALVQHSQRMPHGQPAVAVK